MDGVDGPLVGSRIGVRMFDKYVRVVNISLIAIGVFVVGTAVNVAVSLSLYISLCSAPLRSHLHRCLSWCFLYGECMRSFRIDCAVPKSFFIDCQ